MARTREEILEERRRLKAEYRELFDQVAALLYEEDPAGINFEVNPDEYHPEVGTILPRLSNCSTQEDALIVIHEEFVRWFDEATAGPRERYVKIANAIWQLWKERQPRP